MALRWVVWVRLEFAAEKEVWRDQHGFTGQFHAVIKALSLRQKLFRETDQAPGFGGRHGPSERPACEAANNLLKAGIGVPTDRAHREEPALQHLIRKYGLHDFLCR